MELSWSISNAWFLLTMIWLNRFNTNIGFNEISIISTEWIRQIWIITVIMICTWHKPLLITIEFLVIDFKNHNINFEFTAQSINFRYQLNINPTAISISIWLFYAIPIDRLRKGNYLSQKSPLSDLSNFRTYHPQLLYLTKSLT